MNLTSPNELETQVLIVGGGTGGTAAALAVARTGGKCIVIESTDWIGGQLTSQGVPPDENQWIEGLDGTQGATGSYRDFRNRVRQWYHANRRLSVTARDNKTLNPGNGWVSRLCCEPKIAHEVLQEMLAPHVAAGRIQILLECELSSVELDGDRVDAVTVKNMHNGQHTTIHAKYVLDATECGDLLVMGKIEHAIGAEHRDEYGEPHARSDVADPLDQQAVSWCFALEHRPGEDHTIDRPANYPFWRDYVPALDRKWPGKLFSWTVLGVSDHESKTFGFVPWPDEPKKGQWEMWRYRRIVDRNIYEPAQAGWAPPPDVALINMVQMDHWLKPTLGVSKEKRDQAFAGAREQSLAFIYWMQTEAPRHDSSDRTGYPGLKLRGDELGTSDGFAKHPYIRESVRLKARTIVSEKHVSNEMRKQIKPLTDIPAPLGIAEPFPDSVGIGHYRLDLHPSTAGKAGIYVPAAPFRIPMGALIPIRVRNVLAAAKNLGVTHITNGCFRLHPVEWNIGESAGLLASWCIKHGKEPAQVHENIKEVREFQKMLREQNVVISWPWEGEAGLA